MNLPTLELIAGTDTERERERGIAEAAELTARMLEPRADVSRAAGIMERESPLFFGKGDSPCLF
jgi:hypothetical protein